MSYNSRMSLMNHLIRTHHYTGKQYYDEFYKTDEEGFCENCHKPTKFLNIEDGYAKCCSIKCAMPGRAKRNLEKYGYPDNFHNPEVIKNAHSEEAAVKRRKTMLDRYGVDSYTKSEDFKAKSITYAKTHKDSMLEHRRKTMLEKYGVSSSLNLPNAIANNKIASHSAEANEKRKQTNLARYGVDCVFKIPEVQAKAQANSHTPEAVSKIHANRDYRKIALATAKTKKENGNKSNYELAFEQKCKELRIPFIEEYSDPRYPFPCDYYLPDSDCFVEIHGSWVHRDHIYKSKQDEELVKEWQGKAKKSDYYKVALKTWTEKDPLKLKTAEDNKLNYIILWSIEDIEVWFSLGCPACFQYDTYTWIKKRFISNNLSFPKKITDGAATVSKICKVAQFEEFYKREIQLWNNASIQFQIELYANRLKYINKNPNQLTDLEIIRGLNISGKIKAYTTFNNTGLKYFISKYAPTSIYDPCAGWGERMLTCSANNIKYVGIDINKALVENYKQMFEFYNIHQTIIHADSSTYIPEKCDATFTCPPYWNLEIYTELGAENLSYSDFLEWWKQVIKNSNTPLFAYQINNRFAEDMNKCFVGYDLIDSFTLKPQSSHFTRKGEVNIKTERETVYIFKKQ